MRRGKAKLSPTPRGLTPPPAPGVEPNETTIEPTPIEATSHSAGVEPGGARGVSSPILLPPRPADAALLVWADALDDLERTRIATENRLRSLEQVKHSPEVAGLVPLLVAIQAAERQATLGLQRAMRAHPLGDWVRRTKGVGEKQAARLLAVIGNPATRPNPAKLWAYCGYHVLAGVGPQRRRGQRANWNPIARQRAWLVASSCMKQRESPYRAIYDAGRVKYAEATYPDGAPLSDGHKHARALRLVAKAILLDLWKEAKEETH